MLLVAEDEKVCLEDVIVVLDFHCRFNNGAVLANLLLTIRDVVFDMRYLRFSVCFCAAM